MHFFVYGNEDGSHTFANEQDAYEWAKKQHAENGRTYECRDEDFNHVFTVES